MKDKILKLPVALRVVGPVIAVGLCIGLSAGLYIGWMAWPVQVTNVDITDLRGTAQEDYIILTAKTYAYDQNLDRAQQRLALLNDPNIGERVANLAVSYSLQGKPDSAQLASLAHALGSKNNAIATLLPTPEFVAIMVTPTSGSTSTPTLLATQTPPPIVSIAASRTSTRRATATSTRTPTPQLAPLPPAVFLPADTQNLWPPGFGIAQATVSPGQQFWHLTKAIFCDYPETQYGCSEKSGQTLPGGKGTIGVWVTLVGGKAPLILDGKPALLEDKSSDSECQCTYSLDFPGPTIEVSGHPSDKIIGAANSTAVRGGFPNTHVRYFFTFQLVTR